MTKTKFLFTLCLMVVTYWLPAQIDTTTRFTQLSIDTMGKLNFAVSYFGTSFKGYVQQYKNGGWRNVGELGSGSHVVIRYGGGETPRKKTPAARREFTSFCILKFHKGENRYRIKSSKPYELLSPEIILNSKVSNDDGSVWVSGHTIIRDQAEYFEILNSSGDLIFKGEEKIIDISALSPGSYYLYTKTSTLPFTK